MNRYKAAGIHALLSILIVTSIMVAMYLLWYPNEYFSLMGGKLLITLIAGVDVFLGPLLTLIVYRHGKKSLRFDLACIGVVQVVAMLYGGYVMFESRPVFTVFNKDKFQIAAVVDISPDELAKAKNPQWQILSITGPELVAIGTPDIKDKNETMFAKVESASAYRYPRLYDEYKNHLDKVIKSGKPLARLSEVSEKNKLAVDQFMSKSKRPESDFLYLPITSELAEMSVIVDAKAGDFIEIIDAISETSIE
ncbi:MAG: TfpX/TfpZ family type IV pilin accessory protein [Methylotenera sp.]|nr:TfpX/TfpZ family type IV pilin accessory protein [Methylotenera sp.]